MPSHAINWLGIRALNGSQAEGFEELVAQLARAECRPDWKFERKGTPDGGVECYATLPNGDEWGWQAKYFFTLDSSQLSQLEDSVGTALAKHPRITTYIVCLPMDLPDARVDGKQSARQKWNSRVETWQERAEAKGLKVEYILWGSSELLERLVQQQHLGRRRFWFDDRRFEEHWFVARLQDALSAAGPRYTPELHVELPISQPLDAVGRSDAFFERLKAQMRPLRKAAKQAQSSRDHIEVVAPGGLTGLGEAIEGLGSQVSSFPSDPAGELPFTALQAKLSAVMNVVGDLIERLEAQSGEAKSQDDQRAAVRRLYQLARACEVMARHCEAANKITLRSTLLIKGQAGKGKTHLLCDAAVKRTAQQRPTLLIMGQRFTSDADPWSQVRRMLDVGDLTVEEFVGAIEAAAQAADARALVMLDALNEGKGPTLWPNHLAAFLRPLQDSPWISVVMSVRSPYEDLVLPEGIRATFIERTHRGFEGIEFDASESFFSYYGIETPSVPLLNNEFGNPLFLKLLCEGLVSRGLTRLPRRAAGQEIFSMYFSGVNCRLAKLLGYNPSKNLVEKAMQVFANALVEQGERWLRLDDAESAVNALLPGREFERSLYKHLVSEGLLIEDKFGEEREAIVSIAYDRLADYRIATAWLDRNLDTSEPTVSFEPDRLLGKLFRQDRIKPGLLEAFFCLVPERTGHELGELVPEVRRVRYGGRVFASSLVWRDEKTITKQTFSELDEFAESLPQILDALLTLAVVPGHALNAELLERELRAEPMAERDSWWTVYLHHRWNTNSVLDRLVNWGYTVQPGDSIDRAVVELASIALAWTLSSSNRFLRDKATSALVNLLTNRFEQLRNLVERFAEVDDLYIRERVFAVACGVALRSNCPVSVGRLADVVHKLVFAKGTPVPHILLRDYARLVLEWALYLGAELSVSPDTFRPPFKSTWPNIPGDEEIRELFPELEPETGFTGRDHLRFSVLGDDFARYVIGTNSSQESDKWLSLPLNAPFWERPETLDDVLESLSSRERKEVEKWLSVCSDRNVPKAERNAALEAVAHLCPIGFVSRLVAAMIAERDRSQRSHPPRFNLDLMQRYILGRVAELGWSLKLFGEFDRNVIGRSDRNANKPERVGKKYQWIAYHQMLAYLADHQQFYDSYAHSRSASICQGAWQLGARDIDPTCTLHSIVGGTGWDGHSPGWWSDETYEAWDGAAQEWVLDHRWPNLEGLLRVTDSEGVRWVNLHGYVNWRRPVQPHEDPDDCEQREAFYLFTGYLLNRCDQEPFVSWARTVDFWGRWMPDPADVHDLFLGEHPWAPASVHFASEYYGDEGWTRPRRDCPNKVLAASRVYSREAGNFDCAVDETYSLRLPIRPLIDGMKLTWSGQGANYVGPDGSLVAQDPTTFDKGPTAFLVREDKLNEFLAREDLCVCWTLIGEKRAWAGLLADERASGRVTGAFWLTDDGTKGFVARVREDDDTLGDEHEEAPDRTSVTEDAGRCWALTKNGTRCKFSARPGGYCGKHISGPQNWPVTDLDPSPSKSV